MRSAAPSQTLQDAPLAPVNGLHRLIFFNWWNGLLAMLCGMVVSFFLFGYWYPYWRVADVDVFYIYNVLVMNAGFPQELVDHPNYLVLVMLCGIFRFLHSIGLMHAYSLTTLPPVSDVAAYNLAWTHLVQTARLLSLAIAMTFVVAFAHLMRRLVHDWRIATLSTFALAFSGGLAMSMRSMKSELLAAGLVTCALLILLIAAKTPQMKWRPLLFGLAAMMSTLALENKVQAIFVIAAFPVITLTFGSHSEVAHDFWRRPRAYGALAASILAALLATVLAAPLLREGLFPDADHGRRIASGSYRRLRRLSGRLRVLDWTWAFCFCDRMADPDGGSCNCGIRRHLRLRNRIIGARHYSLQRQHLSRYQSPRSHVYVRR